MDIRKLMLNDTNNLASEDEFAVKIFNEKLRKELIKELVIDIRDTMLKALKNDESKFHEIIENMMINGYKGFKDMNTQTILDLYLEKKTEIDFINLIEKITR